MLGVRMGPAAVALFVLMVGAGCGGQAGTNPAGGVVPQGSYEIKGTVLSLDAGRRIVEIDHEAIPGVMPAMAMPYEVSDAALLQGLATRDRVRGTLRIDSSAYLIVALQKL